MEWSWPPRGRFADALVAGAVGAFVVGSTVLSATHGEVSAFSWLLVITASGVLYLRPAWSCPPPPRRPMSAGS